MIEDEKDAVISALREALDWLGNDAHENGVCYRCGFAWTGGHHDACPWAKFRALLADTATAAQEHDRRIARAAFRKGVAATETRADAIQGVNEWNDSEIDAALAGGSGA